MKGRTAATLTMTITLGLAALAGCSSKAKQQQEAEKAKGAAEALATKAPDAGPADPFASVSPSLKPPPGAVASAKAATGPVDQVTHTVAVPPNAPGLCKADADCPLKGGVPQRCCIQQPGVVAPGPALGCQADGQACWKPCATDTDCPVRSECLRVPGAEGLLRGCGHV